MEDVVRVPAQHPITPVIALPEVGVLPDDFATFDYANAWIAGDSVFVTYHRSWVEADESGSATTLGERHGTARKPRENVLRVYPVDWFYD